MAHDVSSQTRREAEARNTLAGSRAILNDMRTKDGSSNLDADDFGNVRIRQGRRSFGKAMAGAAFDASNIDDMKSIEKRLGMATAETEPDSQPWRDAVANEHIFIIFQTEVLQRLEREMKGTKFEPEIAEHSQHVAERLAGANEMMRERGGNPLPITRQRPDRQRRSRHLDKLYRQLSRPEYQGLPMDQKILKLRRWAFNLRGDDRFKIGAAIQSYAKQGTLEQFEANYRKPSGVR